MRTSFSMALVAASFMALTALPAQALEMGPVQVILQPRVVVFPESRPRPRVVVVEEEHCPTVIEKRVVVVHKKGPRWEHRDHARKHGRRHDIDRYERDWDRDHDYDDRVAHREVVVIRR